jgi:hypothetical protein
MARLVAERHSAVARIGELEQQQRAAAEAREVTRAQLIEFERRGDGKPAMRDKLEAALADAERKASERWPERIEGARHAVRDAEHELRLFTAEHLHELVGEVEARGAEAAADVVAAAEALLEAYRRRAQAEQQIGELVTLAGARIHPADIGPPTRAERAAAECTRLVEEGEPGPQLRRYPGEPRHPTIEPAASVSAA